jgi:hypothetical protein
MSDACRRLHPVQSRRELLRFAGGGFGMLALGAMLGREAMAETSANPMAARPPHFAPRAKSVIWLFMNGGPSHIDTFDYKPALEAANGKTLDGFDHANAFFDDAVGPLMKSPFAFKRHGQSGAWASSLFPHLARHVDKMAFIKSYRTNSNNHSPALFTANSGVRIMGRPSVGSWITYGLGTQNQNLPAFVVMSDPLERGMPKGHAANWGSGFLPAAYQGTWIDSKGEPIPNLTRLPDMSGAQQRSQLDFIHALNDDYRRRHPDEAAFEARVESFELAYRMQSEAPECFDIAREPRHIHKLYGLDDRACAHFGRQCLLARRMVERGVRFVQLYSGGTANARCWDGHSDIVENHGQFARETDKPIAGLLADLDQRGLLKDTLVIWGGEFGRLPVSQLADGKPTGRDHNPNAGVFWLAGGGIKGGVSYGETDEIGYKSVVDPVDIHDIHATLLHLLGLDHKRLTYMHSGRRFRLTDVAGNVLNRIIA